MSEAYRRGCQPGLCGGRPGAAGGIQPSGHQPPPPVRSHSPVSISVECLKPWHLWPEDTASPLCCWKGFQALQGEAAQRSLTFSGMDRVQTRWSSEK